MAESKTDTYKHKADIDAYAPADCPPIDASPTDTDSFRFVMEPMIASDFHSFIQLKKLPKQTETIHNKCKRCGLSLFDSKQSAIDNYNNNPYRSKLPYTHIAQGKILKTHGKCTPPNKGHFTLFEYVDVDLMKEFSIICPIPK